MPRITFSTSNVRSAGNRFPTVKLNSNETWRIVFAEPEATYEWVHVFRKPKLSPINGRLLEREISYKNGDVKMVPDTDFVNDPLCLGNIDTLEDRGVDPDNCPGCRAALDYQDWFNAPERRFAVHVLKYQTHPGSARVVTPLGLETRVWRLSEKRYALVSERIEEFGGDPMGVDLILGPCTSQTYQNYEISGTPTCVVRQSEQTQQQAQATFQGNNAGDLSAYCGKRSDARSMQSDIDEVIGRWRAANQAGAPVPPPDFAGTLAETGAALIEPSSRSQPPTADLSALDETVGSQPPAEAPAPEKPAAKRGPSVGFGDLMEGLNLAAGSK